MCQGVYQVFGHTLDSPTLFPYNPSMDIFLLLQAIVSVLLLACILLQHRAAGLTAGGSGMNTMVVQRRGAEKLLFQATIVLTIAFFVLTIVQWFVY
jgi:protein translocase SecG subunit